MLGNVCCEIEIIAFDGLFAMWLSHSSKIELAIGIKKLRATILVILQCIDIPLCR